ncbi:hypothetical protein FRC01_001450 [Tulasnella sp. 417]|nr:hypothetical protein FRC01_001450 [Tulasnella sp. 417]
MPPLRVGYVREHFASPLLQYAEDDGGKTFTLVSCPGGTGQIIKALEDDQVDVVIALTDGLIAGIAKGKPYKLVGSYVSTPLNWAIVTGKDSKHNSRADLKGTTFGISRFGSGSELMVKLMARQERWVKGDGEELEDIDFKVPTPWPSWMIAAHTSPERCPRDNVINFAATLTSYVNDFDSEASRKVKDVEFIKKQFGYPEEDIKAWLETVGYPTDCTKIDGSMLVRTLSILEATGAIVRPPSGFDPEDLTNIETVRVE